MVHRAYVAVATVLLFPLAALSATFPASSIWLSDASPSVGDKVSVYAVVFNDAESALTGSVVFLVDGKENGSRPISLDPGESQVVSSLWTAIEGEHSFSARISDGGGGGATVSAAISASVAAPPSQTEQALQEAKAVTAKVASSSMPVISAVASTVFAATESIRNAGIEYLENAQRPAAATTQRATSSPVEGFETASMSASADDEEPGILGSVAQTASAAALFTLRSMWLFYPLLVLALLFIFRSLYRWATGPRI